MKFPIANIVVRDRKRELGDIATLAKSIQEIGLLNPITIQPNGDLIAGYHRLFACKSLSWVEIEVNMVDLPALQAELAEIDENLIRNELHWLDRDKQLARRKEIYEALHPGTKQGGDRKSEKSKDDNRPLIPSFVADTAKKTSYSPTTVKESIQRAKTFTEKQGEILKRTAIPQTEATRLARFEEPKRAAVIETLATGKAKDVKEAETVLKREQAKEHIVHLKTNGVELPTGKYSCIVIDPPWPMQKIERDVRPNQVGFDYPTMTEDELKAFPLPDIAADDCHLYLWTTQKYLPLSLRLAEHWGFKYQCLLTWVKNVGFTPFSWMYSTEHVLFCRKGNLPLLQIGRRLDFHARVQEHSRKPDEFYNLVRDVSPGPRIDVFSREKRDGFEQYGNEVEKFVSVG